MQIVINLDMEKIVREAVIEVVRENLVINHVPGCVEPSTDVTDTHTMNVVVETSKGNPDLVEEYTEDSVESVDSQHTEDPTTVTKTKPVVSEEDGIDYEYAPQPGRRRSKKEMAYHEKELFFKRRLTADEKGQIDAFLEIDSKKQAKAKDAALEKARVENIAAEATEAAKAELAQEAASTADAPEGVIGESRAAEETEQASEEALDNNINNMFDDPPFDTEESNGSGQEGVPDTSGVSDGIDNLFSN